MDSRGKLLLCFALTAVLYHVESLGDDVEEKIGGRIVRSCTVIPRQRVRCGSPRIKEEVCENRGCCYSEEYKHAHWCFYPSTHFTPPTVEKIMKCVSMCAKLPWRKTVQAGAACQTNVACWKVKQTLTAAICMSGCKSNTSVPDIIANVSSCLKLSDESRTQTRNKCGFGIKCWLKTHGGRARKCLNKLSNRLEGRQYKIVPKDLTELGTIAKQPDPEIETPPYRRKPPVEPDQSEYEWLLEPDPNTVRTDENVEKSVLPPAEDLTGEEEPNPWWEEQVRA